MFYLMLVSNKEIEQVPSQTQVFKSWTDAYQTKNNKVIDWAESMINTWFELCVVDLDVSDIGPDYRMFFCGNVDVVEREGGYYLVNDTDMKSVRYFRQEYYKLIAQV